jgi:hypothetical protein
MTKPQRPVVGVEVAAAKQPALPSAKTSAAELLIAKDLPPWDLLPSDLVVVRRRT